MKWGAGDRVGVYLDLEENYLFYFVNGNASPDGVAFIKIPKGKYHFYFSGANKETAEIVESHLFISTQSDLYQDLKLKMKI